MAKEQPKVHLIEDKSIGGVQREYIEVDCEAKTGDKIVIVDASYTGGTYGDGDILTVSDDYGMGGSVNCKDIATEENYNGQIDDEEYLTLDPTDIVHIDGTRYEIAKRKAEVGEKVLVVRSNVTMGAYRNGDVMEVIEFQREVGDGAVYVNRKFHDGSQVFLNLPEYRVLTQVDSEPDIHDLLANLAQRVTSLERITGELVRAKSSVESQLNDAIRNNERLAQELESVKRTADTALRKAISVDDRDDITIDRVSRLEKELEREQEYRASIYVKVSDLQDLVESNTKDIAFLDERTYEKPGKPTKSAEEILRTILKLVEENGVE